MTDVVEQAEAVVAEALDALAAPLPAECLSCYLRRTMIVIRCDGSLRLSQRWFATRRSRPGQRGLRTTRFAEGLARRGGYCDCEVILNAFAGDRPSDDRASRPPCSHGPLRWRQ